MSVMFEEADFSATRGGGLILPAASCKMFQKGIETM